ncbi:Zeaxanthin epoxidase [Arachis hypogaea]|nr:Zeaxanthin epoxidase [Arachis hypogaea]
MTSTYKAYLGVGLGPLEFLTKFRIPHPGRVGGRFFVDIMMPTMLSWVLGGLQVMPRVHFPFSNNLHLV